MKFSLLSQLKKQLNKYKKDREIYLAIAVVGSIKYVKIGDVKSMKYGSVILIYPEDHFDRLNGK